MPDALLAPELASVHFAFQALLIVRRGLKPYARKRMCAQYRAHSDICQGICVLCYDAPVMARKEKPFDRELFFRALADSTRLRIINIIGDQEVCVCFFVEILKTNQPKISRHLAYLRRAGIVAARREGIWMHYRVATPRDENAAKVLTEVRQWLAK